MLILAAITTFLPLASAAQTDTFINQLMQDDPNYDYTALYICGVANAFEDQCNTDNYNLSGDQYDQAVLNCICQDNDNANYWIVRYECELFRDPYLNVADPDTLRQEVCGGTFNTDYFAGVELYTPITYYGQLVPETVYLVEDYTEAIFSEYGGYPVSISEVVSSLAQIYESAAEITGTGSSGTTTGDFFGGGISDAVGGGLGGAPKNTGSGATLVVTTDQSGITGAVSLTAPGFASSGARTTRKITASSVTGGFSSIGSGSGSGTIQKSATVSGSSNSASSAIGGSSRSDSPNSATVVGVSSGAPGTSSGAKPTSGTNTATSASTASGTTTHTSTAGTPTTAASTAGGSSSEAPSGTGSKPGGHIGAATNNMPRLSFCILFLLLAFT